MARCGNCVYFDDYGSGEGRCTYFDISMDSGVSACVAYMGKADNCEELTTLRAFRDGYMSSTEDGRALIKEYYAVAPSIARKMQRSKNAKEYFADVYRTILRCIEYINQGNNETAVDTYKQMVLKYQAL